ncbi:MAG: BrnT family toxin [Granulosicoccaceae bacterium]
MTRYNQEQPDDEDCWNTLGLSGGQHYLVVVHTYRDEHDNSVTIRLISALHATKHEITQYHG